MFCKILLSLLSLVVCARVGVRAGNPPLHLHYGFTVKAIAPGSPVRVWIPAAHSDPFQEIKVITAGGDLPLKKTRESRFGNEIVSAQVSKADKPEHALRDRV